MARKKPARKKKPAGRKKSSARAKSSPKIKKPVRRKKVASRTRLEVTSPIPVRNRRGLGAAAGGQSGDIQGLSRTDDIESESVEELVEEGQYLEAEAVRGVENAKDPDESEVTTSEVPEDDVPDEYIEPDKP